MAKKRRGMVIKNTNDRAVRIEMARRSIMIRPGEERLITAEEVRDPVLREHLQVRAVSIVRPATPEEEATLDEELESDQ